MYEVNHMSSEARDRTRQRILDSQLEVELAYAETISLVLAHVTVSDNENAGCAEAIEKYLL